MVARTVWVSPLFEMSKPPGNLSADKQALLTLRRLRARVEELERAQTEPIAVIGLGCRFPGGASSPDAYWTLLHGGVDGISEVPADRWDIDRYYDRNPDAPGKMSTRWGGWIAGPDRFDAQFFGIAPREAVSLDPQQRMLLEITWEALEHAGIAPQSLAGTEAGVFIGISTSDYGQFQLRHADQSEPDAYFGTGNAINAAAGRLSYVLGLLGPSLSVDTACSSSLVAIHLACQSLRRGESTLAIAGGVNFILLPELTVNFSRAHMMAADGRCKTFDAAADGYVRGEGCGVVLLKRLSDALANGDRVLAVVRGSAVNQDGRSGGFTAPSELSQQALIRRALAQASVEPAAIDYVEAHGTGTSLGDPIEVQALGAVLGGGRSAQDRFWVGSAKTNIGHLEAAAGIAGLIKVVLSFEHEEIPPHLHFSNPNPYIPWDDLPIRVPTSAVPWRRGERRRLAGVSSFGFTGTNAHVILEEPPVEPRADESESRDHVLCLSAKNDTALAALAAAYAERLKSDGHSLADVCFTSAAGRSHFNERLAIVGSNIREMAGELEGFVSSGKRPAVFRGTVPTSAPPDVALLFTGQGSQYAGMGRQLYAVEPAFRDAFDRCAESLNTLDAAARTQPALFAFEYALAELWRSWGVKPSFVLGHGIGEYVAACVAGVFSLDDALKLVAARGRLSGGGVTGADVSAPDEIVLSEGELDAFERVAREVTYHAPAIAIASNLTGEVVAGDLLATPSYWRRQAREAVRFADGLRAVAAQGCRVFVEVGPRPALIGLGRPVLADGGVAWVPSMIQDRDELRQMLDAVAALYVQGVPIDWTRVHGTQRRRVALPTYPFQRERHWVDIRPQLGPAVQSAHAPGAADRSPDSDWLYETVWERQASTESSEWLEPAGIPAQARGWVSALLPAAQLGEQAAVKQALEDLSIAFVVKALVALGWQPQASQSVDEDALAGQLRIAAQHRRLFTRFLGMLADEGILARFGGSWTVVRAFEPVDPGELCAQMCVTFPDLSEQLAFIRRCGEGLADVLTGATNPLELLFPNGSSAQAEHIYRDSPLARSFNTFLANTVEALASRLPGGREIRILEVGAGTGGSSSFVFPVLPPDRTVYVFSDVAKLLLTRAEDRFAAYPFLRYSTLNIEVDPSQQGFTAGQFDIVIAANVIHATRDLATTAGHIKKLLAPGGVFLLLEATEALGWVDLTFGLTEGWWRFADLDLRASHPLLSRSKWLAFLREQGFDDVAAIPGDATAPEQTLIMARTPQQMKDGADAAREWLFLGDSSGIADAAAARLRENGERVISVSGKAGDLTRQIAELAGRGEGRELTIVDLRSLDVADPADAASDAGTGGVLRLVRQLTGGVEAKQLRLWFVTRGAQAVDAAGVAAPEQAPVWGIARVVGLEHPDIWGGLIDLDPQGSASDQAHELVDIVRRAGDDDQIGVRNHRRFVPRLTRSSRSQDRELVIDPKGAYLITGGLGRLGLKIARWLGERGAGTIGLLGRRGLPDRSAWQPPFKDAETERQVRGIQRIEATGASVLVMTGDVANAETMRRIFDELDAAAPIKGIVHAATDWGVVPLTAMTTAQVSSMLEAKIKGTRILEELTRNRSLDFLVLFSSTAVWGAGGLGHYAAANQYLDAFACAARQKGLAVTSIDWGAWEGLRLEHESDEDRYAEIGLNFMPSDQALTLMGELIAGGVTNRVVASIDWSRLKSVFEARRHRPFFDRIDVSRRDAGSEAAPSSSTIAQVLEAEPEDRRDRLASLVGVEVVRVLKLGAHKRLDHNQGLFEMGMDSLMSVELKGRLESLMGRSLPSTLTFNYPSVAALAGYLESLLPGAPVISKREPPRRPAELKAVRKKTEEARPQMSEDDLAQLLADRLQRIR